VLKRAIDLPPGSRNVMGRKLDEERDDLPDYDDLGASEGGSWTDLATSPEADPCEGYGGDKGREIGLWERGWPLQWQQGS
jgi:hypothetical protein